MRRFSSLRRPVGLLRAVVALSLTMAACSSTGTPTSPTPPTPPVTTPPPPAALAITCPSNQNATSANGGPVTVSFAAPSTTGGIAPVQVSCSRASGSPFPVGTTMVQCSATDAAPTTRSCTFNVNVAAPTPQLSRTRFLAFGDSTTAGEVPVSMSVPLRDRSPDYRLIIIPTASYPSQLLSLLRGRYTGQVSILEMTNSGLPNEWAEDGALRLPGVLTNVRPQAVLLMEGINDLAALGTRGVQSAWRALDVMAKESRNRGARVFIATLPPPRAGGSKAVALTLIQSLNANIRDTARGEGAVLVDVFQALSTNINLYMTVDGLHPTEAGYQKIADTFYQAIQQDLEAR